MLVEVFRKSCSFNLDRCDLLRRTPGPYNDSLSDYPSHVQYRTGFGCPHDYGMLKGYHGIQQLLEECGNSIEPNKKNFYWSIIDGYENCSEKPADIEMLAQSAQSATHPCCQY